MSTGTQAKQRTYRILRGVHSEGRRNGPQGQSTRRIYAAKGLDVPGNLGDIIVTDRELDKLHNSPGSFKFERIDTSETGPRLPAQQHRERLGEYADVTPVQTQPVQQSAVPQATISSVPPAGDGLEGNDREMTLSELRAQAAAKGIDTSSAKTKQEVLKAIRDAGK